MSIVRDARGNKEQCVHNSQAVAEYARKFPGRHWSFLEPGSEEKWYGTRWIMGSNGRRNDSHPIFRASNAFARGELRSKEGEK